MTKLVSLSRAELVALIRALAARESEKDSALLTKLKLELMHWEQGR